jgi:23S rRNA pseudouridine1911/1915/1917 synthase
MFANGAFRIQVDESESGKRLDTLIASRITEFSRSIAANLIRNGSIRVEGLEKKPGYRVKAGDEISGLIPPPEVVAFEPEAIPIDILFEDEHILLVNKQPGMVVHPAPGHYRGTLVNALLHYLPDLEGIGRVKRPGIVHRLDKDTSGLLVVAKSAAAHNHLSQQFKSRVIQKKYLALVLGVLPSREGTISLPIGRHPVDRKRMSTLSRHGRTAETEWHVKERFQSATFLELNLKTGRTHQIRVHCAAINHPIIGDPVYCGRQARKNKSRQTGFATLLDSVRRQMLHAWYLEFHHPLTRERMSFESPLPQDMQQFLDVLRSFCCS